MANLCKRAARTPARTINRGKCYQTQSNWEAALADYNKAIAIDSQNAFAYDLRGQTFRKKGDLTAALRDLDHATELRPALFESFFYKGLVCEALAEKNKNAKQWQEAIVAFNEYVKREPNPAEADKVQSHLQQMKKRKW